MNLGIPFRRKPPDGWLKLGSFHFSFPAEHQQVNQLDSYPSFLRDASDRAGLLQFCGGVVSFSAKVKAEIAKPVPLIIQCVPKGSSDLAHP